MDWSPPSSETIMNGTPHQVLTMIAANRCQKVSSSQAGEGRCSASSAVLMMPPSASMKRQPKTVTKVGTAQGSTRISRYSVRPRSFWLSSSARPRPMQ